MKRRVIAVNISWNPHYWQKPYSDPRAGHSYARKHPGHESVNFHFNKSGIDSKTHVYGFSQWRYYPKQFSDGGYVVFYTRNLDTNESQIVGVYGGVKILNPPQQFHYEKFEEDEIIVVAPSNHPLTKKKKGDLTDLLKEPWIVREEGSGTQMAVEKALRKKGKSLKQFNVVIEMGSTSAVKEGVKAGLGLAFISQRAVEEELKQGIFSRIHVEGIDPVSRQIYIVSRRERTLSPIGMEFLRFLHRKESSGDDLRWPLRDHLK